MAETTPSPVLEQLELALVEPEPMCLVMVEIELQGGADFEPLDPDYCHGIMDEAGVRLRGTLRRYDEMLEVSDNSWALILRTLADATVLAGRMRAFFEVVSEPYTFHDGEVIVAQVVLGMPRRIPQDTPESLVVRVERAMESARSSGAVGPVVI